jgi:DNA-binding CsgD family transcriptional regulator
MDHGAIHSVFVSLTEKQEEALRLACQHLTSKQIAQELGVAPVTIDKRIDAVRAKLGHMSRVEVLRHYRAWAEAYDRTIDDPTILTPPPSSAASTTAQPQERPYVFEDSLAFDARAPWDRSSDWLQPRIRPSDLGISGKLLLIALGAVAIMAVAVLSMAFANALATML